MKFRHCTMVLAATILGGSYTPQLAQTTLFVDATTCPSTGSGSAADPFCRIQDAIDASVTDDIILVMPGTYTEMVNFRGSAAWCL